MAEIDAVGDDVQTLLSELDAEDRDAIRDAVQSSRDVAGQLDGINADEFSTSKDVVTASRQALSDLLTEVENSVTGPDASPDFQTQFLALNAVTYAALLGVAALACPGIIF